MVSSSIITIYENYLEEMRRAALSDARHFGGLSKILTGKQGRAAELLPVFDARLENEIKLLFGQQSSSGEVRELAEWMLERVEDSRDEPRLKYSLMAVQRHLLPLISCLSGEDAAVLKEKFETVIPRRERFPVQKNLISRLREQAHI